MSQERRTVRLGQLLPAIGIELDDVVRNIRAMEELYWEKAGFAGNSRMQTLDAIVQTLEQLSICCTVAGCDATNVEVTEECIAVLSLGRLRNALSGYGAGPQETSGGYPAGDVEFF